MSACAASAAVSALTLGPRLDAGLVVDVPRLVLVVLDDGRLLLAVRVDGRLDLAGDVGGVVSSFVAEQVVDKRVNLRILSPLRQAIEYVDDLDLDGRFFRRCGCRSRGRRSPLRFIGGDVLRADLLFFSYSVFCLLDLVLLAGRTRCRPRRRRHAFRFSRRCAQTSV